MARILKLEDRSVIRLSGPDSRSLLQGLVTNDMDLLEADSALYAALLTPQGKFLFDMIIVSGGADLLLDIESARKADLVRRLMMYKLRADVEITDDPSSVWALFDGEAQNGVAYRDPRHGSLHLRVIADQNPVPDAESMTRAEYDERRIRHGIPDSSRDMKVEKDFWLETGAEKLNGVSFTKGCFIGQELTARMKHRTTLKKMLVPVEAEGHDLEDGAAITTSTGKSVGEIRSSVGAYALAYLRLEYLNEPLTANGIALAPLKSDKA